ncbi:phage capsid protein [Robbsia andropogonis]|uniref:phage capsid protein n=1 Tax=Robbsia andropogonis TaxID=28092 RepID=UPI003D23C53C
MGPILPASAFDYSEMEKIGEVTISQKEGRVWIFVQGFEFSRPLTCREHGAKVTAWLADLLSAQLAAERVAPAGELGVSIG